MTNTVLRTRIVPSYRASQPANDDKAWRDSGGGVGMVCSIRRLRRARGVQLSDRRALPAAARGVVVDRREGLTVGAGRMWALLETLPTNAVGRLMARSCRANGCQPVGSVFLLRNRSLTRSTTLLPTTGTPSCISSPRAVHAISLLRCSIKRLALACMVLGTVAKTVASSPLIGARTAPSDPDPGSTSDSFTVTTRSGSLMRLSVKTLYRCNT